jgi:TetR/AcrR family transcriptional regulator, regulator of cefoperazone and chloramphenicol sensitivity
MASRATPHRHIAVRPSDLSPYARIRNAAMELFAAKGVDGTSIRDVASAAGVSSGLVQHHFGTKAGLREAVNEYVIDVAVETFRDLFGEGDEDEVWTAMGDTVTAWVRDNAVAIRYVARALADGDREAQRVFHAVVEIARSQWLEPLARAGELAAGVDRDWAAVHVIVFNLASVLFEPAISRQLPKDFFDPAELQRWNTATTQLYRRGLTKSRS